MQTFSEEEIRLKWSKFLNESDSVKEKRAEAIEISSNRKLSKSENYNFEFLFYEYKLDKGEFPVQPSAKLDGTFDLIVRTNKGSLETEFIYNSVISDYLNSKAESNPRLEIKDLKEFKAFINDEEIKLDKGTAKKISSNLKIDEKTIKEEFKKSFDLYKATNYNKIKSDILEIVKSNIELDKFQDMMDKSDDISKIIKKHKTPIQKIVYYRDILVLCDGYLNEKMRIAIKKLLDSYETELWSINDTKLRRNAEEMNSEVMRDLGKINSGKLIYVSRKEEVSQDF